MEFIVPHDILDHNTTLQSNSDPPVTYELTTPQVENKGSRTRIKKGGHPIAWIEAGKSCTGLEKDNSPSRSLLPKT
ncbi:hypothetical protein V5O48_014297, partial [Marasmius crinis-equi]